MFETENQINTTKLEESFNGNITFDKAAPDTFRILAPFYHEDGDMYDLFLQIKEDKMQICDLGTTLMRLSYSQDLDTDNKVSIFSKIVHENCVENENGNLIMPTTYETFFTDLMQYQVAISKVSNMNILKREIIKSMFFEYMGDFILNNLTKYNVVQNYIPTNDKQLIVDYKVPGSKPVFIFGVNENTKASKVVISCLNFQKKKIPFRSLIVHENFDNLSSFNRNQITNAVDKQYTSLEDFKAEGIDYIKREIAS